MKCPNCGKQFEPSHRNTRTCGKKECAAAWRNKLRWGDPETRDRLEVSRARSVLRNPSKHGPGRVATAQAIVDDADGESKGK